MLRFFAATMTSGSSAASLPAAAAVALLLLLLLGSIKNGANRCRLLARSAVESSGYMVHALRRQCTNRYISSGCSNSTAQIALVLHVRHR
jgi:hypothetical protein